MRPRRKIFRSILAYAYGPCLHSPHRLSTVSTCIGRRPIPSRCWPSPPCRLRTPSSRCARVHIARSVHGAVCTHTHHVIWIRSTGLSRIDSRHLLLLPLLLLFLRLLMMVFLLMMVLVLLLLQLLLLIMLLLLPLVRLQQQKQQQQHQKQHQQQKQQQQQQQHQQHQQP
jgi:hypothetical protein